VDIIKLRPSSRTWWDHVRARRASRRRQAGARRQIGQIAGGMRQDLRAARRDAGTAAAAGRSELTVAAARSLEAAMTRLARHPNSTNG
jgi:hypothetical protein